VSEFDVPMLCGIDLLRRVRSAESRDPRVPVFMISSSCTLSMAAAAGRAGVTDCFSLDSHGISALAAQAREIGDLVRTPIPTVLLGSSSAVAAARERVLSLADLQTPVLVTGERGTGHQLVASYLHRSGKLMGSPFRRVNCTARPDSLPQPESVTWLLEEVHDLSAAAQAAWRDFFLSNAHAPERLQCRVIATTTRDLRVLGAQHSFDVSLARDLSQFEVWLPPLRERREDLPELIHALLREVSERIGRGTVAITPKATERLCACAWWENMAELERTLESLAAFAPGGEITESDAELVVIDSDPVARAARDRMRTEREELLRLLDECGGNFTRIAERLKVDRGTVRYRLRKHGLLQREASAEDTRSR
jgi:DNA-binding NtrC family response regulator